MIENAEDFLEDYVSGLCHNLRESVYNKDGMQTALRIKIETALEIVAGLGAKVSKNEEVIVLPHISIDWNKSRR